MKATESPRTTDLIEEAHQTRLRAERAVGELTRVTTEARETVSYLQWWRFLGYDPAAVEFLEKLDLKK